MAPYLTIYEGRLLVTESGTAFKLSDSAEEPCCCCNVEGLTLTYSAGGGDGHRCDAANYTCFISSPPGQEIEIGNVNLNNSSRGDLVVVTLTITAAQAREITRGAEDCCILTARLRCDTPPNQDLGWGLGRCHSDLARLTVTAKDKTGNDLIVFQGRAGEAAISLNACPQNT